MAKWIKYVNTHDNFTHFRCSSCGEDAFYNIVTEAEYNDMAIEGPIVYHEVEIENHLSVYCP